MQVTAANCRDVAKAMQSPYLFGKEWLGLKDIPGTNSHWTSDQQKVIDAVLTHKRVAVVSGNGVGKSHLGASLIPYVFFIHQRVFPFATSFLVAWLGTLT